MITEEQLAEWQRIADAATEGPWINGLNLPEVANNNPDQKIVWSNSMYLGRFDSGWVTEKACIANATLSAAARSAVPTLIAEVRRLQEVAHWAQAVLTAWNVGDLPQECKMHQKLREVMIAYRERIGT